MLRRDRFLYLIYPALFAYLVFIRTHNVTQTFWLLSEQIRDWRIALGPFTDLPWVGTPSTAGGTTLGPVYYWVLWIIRVTLGPFYEHLPHAGAIGISVIQSAADVFLCYALAARLRSVIVALAVVLFAATSPYEMALSATVWNPPVAVALSKIAIALVLLPREWSMGRLAAVVAVSWLSIHAHMGALPVAAATIGWMLLQPFFRKDYRRGFAAIRLALEIIVILQLPYVLDHLSRPRVQSAGVIAGSLGYVLQNPGELRIAESWRALGNVMTYLMFAPFPVRWTGSILALAALLGAWILRREPAALVASVVPLALVVMMFSIWQGTMGEHYWYLPLVLPAVLTLALPVSAAPTMRWGWIVPALTLIVVLALQPARCEAAWQIHRVPHYGSLVRGSRQAARQVPELRAIVFPYLPKPSDPAYLYEVFGGRINPEASTVAIIDEEGHVRYQR